MNSSIIQSGSSNTPVVRLRRWGYPLTKTYNGFTGAERVRGWQVCKWLQDTDQMIDPGKQTCECSICGSTKSSSYHNENYYAPWTAKLVCKSCHYLLHTRFRNGVALDALLKRAGRRKQAKWVYALTSNDVDLACDLRAQHGVGIRDFPELNSSPHPFPFEQLYPL